MSDELKEAHRKLEDYEKLAQQGSTQAERALRDAGTLREAAQTEVREIRKTLNDWKSFVLEGTLADTEWMTRDVDVKLPMQLTQEGYGVTQGYVHETGDQWLKQLDIDVTSGTEAASSMTNLPPRVLALRTWYTASTKSQNLSYASLHKLILALKTVDTADCAIVLGFLEASLSTLSIGTGAVTDQVRLFMLRGMEYFQCLSDRGTIGRQRLGELNDKVLLRLGPQQSLLPRAYCTWLRKRFANALSPPLAYEVLYILAGPEFSAAVPSEGWDPHTHPVTLYSEAVIELSSEPNQILIAPDGENVLILPFAQSDPSITVRRDELVSLKFADNRLDLLVYVKGYPVEGYEIMLKAEWTAEFLSRFDALFPQHTAALDE